MTRYATRHDSPWGPLTLHARAPKRGEPDAVLTGLYFEGDPRGEAGPLVWDDPALFALRDALLRYLSGLTTSPALTWELEGGTPFQRDVWRALASIPRGETRTYAELARAVGRPRAVRAVGAANARNPLPIVLPCHRVIGSDGRLTGYAGGLPLKKHLLTLEGVHVRE